MAQALVSQADTAPAPQGLLARAIGVIFAPRKTYGGIALHPRVFGALATTVVIIVAGTSLFVSSEVGRQSIIDAQVRQVESMGRTMTDAQYQSLERFAPFFAVFTAVSQIIFIPLLALAVAGIGYALFTAMLGGNATYKQVLAVVAHAGFVPVLMLFLILPLDYVRESLTSPTSLSVFVPFLDENTFVARLLSSIDLQYIWWSVNLAIGLGVLYRRRTGPIAVGILGVYGVIALLIAAVRTALSGA
jgi:hypothetical protein